MHHPSSIVVVEAKIRVLLERENAHRREFEKGYLLLML